MPNEAYPPGSSNGQGQPMNYGSGEGSPRPYQGTQRDAQLPPGLGDISALYNPFSTPTSREEAEQVPMSGGLGPGIQSIGQSLQSLGTPGSNGNTGAGNSLLDGIGSLGETGQDLGGSLSKLSPPGLSRNVFGQGGIIPSTLGPYAAQNKGPTIGALHTGVGNPSEGGQQSSNNNLISALDGVNTPPGAPTPNRALLPPVYSPVGLSNVNVTTVPANEKGGSSRGFQTGLGGDDSMVQGGAHAPNGTIIPTANAGATDAGFTTSAREGPKGVTVGELSGNDTSQTHVNPLADAASYADGR